MEEEAKVGESGRSKVDELLARGQSLWLDTLSRNLMDSGELSRLIKISGIRGITTNPTIFEKAISGSADYDREIAELLEQDLPPEDVLRFLMVGDVQRACDLFLPVFRSSGGQDGFVSIEVHPGLAHRTGDSIGEALRLRSMIDRPNLLVKIPGTEEGISAIRSLVGVGISVNVTLLFSPELYRRSALAYIEGLESWVSKGRDASRINGVASLFVSRVDTVVDARLERIMGGSMDAGLSQKAAELRGKAGIANAQVVYQLFEELFGERAFAALANRGARVQRPLWASTGTKNPDYSDVLYVERLIGADTVNTLPLATFRDFLDHGRVERSIDRYKFDLRSDHPQSVFGQLSFLGIGLEEIYSELLRDGIAGFDRSWKQLVSSLGRKAEEMKETKKTKKTPPQDAGAPEKGSERREDQSVSRTIPATTSFSVRPRLPGKT